MNKKYIVRQSGFKDCAVACLLSIIRYNGSNVSKSELEYLVKCDNRGTNAYDMIKGMNLLGYKGKGIRLSFKELLNEEDNLFPVIAHMKNKYGYHYVVIYKINKKKKYLEIMDPGRGMIKESYESFKNNYLNTILIFKKVKEISCLNDKNELLNFIISRISLNKNKIITISIFSILITVLSLLMNYSMKINIDYIVSNNLYNYVVYIIILFILIVLLKNILSFIRDKFIRDLEIDLDNKINYKLIDHLFNIPYRYFYNKPTGEMISRVNDLEILKNFLYELFLNIFVDIFIVVISIIALFIINYKLTIIFLLFVIVYLIISIIFKNIYKSIIDELQQSLAYYQTGLLENINAFESIKNLNRTYESIKSLDYRYYISSKNNYKFKKVSSIENIIKDILIDLVYVFIVNFGICFLRDNTLSLGDLVSFISIYTFSITPIKSILNGFVEYVYSLNIYNRINDFLLIKEDKNSLSNEKIDGDIVFKNISYSLDDKILDNINLKINKSDKVFLKGKSGSGKSTLLKLLKKYITDYEGNIYINNIDIRNIENSIISNSILYVSQNERIYTTSIKDNILLNRNIPYKKYDFINKITLVDDIINSKYFKDDEIIESDGFNISGGEKQKIILARSLHRDFNYLILDEALSEVDEEDEIKIIKNILEVYKDKTIIYVSHKSKMSSLFKKKVIIGGHNE